MRFPLVALLLLSLAFPCLWAKPPAPPQNLSANPVENALGLSLNLDAVQIFLKRMTEKEGNQSIL
jgi:hypothetical protein